jgi:hypothetical protein
LETTDIYSFGVERQILEKKHLGRTRPRWANNIKMDLNETGWGYEIDSI